MSRIKMKRIRNTDLCLVLIRKELILSFKCSKNMYCHLVSLFLKQQSLYRRLYICIFFPVLHVSKKDIIPREDVAVYKD